MQHVATALTLSWETKHMAIDGQVPSVLLQLAFC